VAQGVDIITFSGGGHFGPHNGQSNLDKLVDEIVTTKNVLWVNAAGNEGDEHWMGKAVDANKNGWIDIGPGDNEVIALQVGKDGVGLMLNWDDWGANPDQPSATQDIDLYIFAVDQATGQAREVAKSVNPQKGRGAPVEVAGVNAPAGTVLFAALKA